MEGKAFWAGGALVTILFHGDFGGAMVAVSRVIDGSTHLTEDQETRSRSCCPSHGGHSVYSDLCDFYRGMFLSHTDFEMASSMTLQLLVCALLRLAALRVHHQFRDTQNAPFIPPLRSCTYLSFTLANDLSKSHFFI